MSTLRLDPGAEGAPAVEIDLEALGAPGAQDGAPASPWRLASAPDWSRVEALRLIAGRFSDGTAVALVSVRTPGGSGHDTDALTASVMASGAEPSEAREALLSTEYDGAGRVRRIGLELWTAEDPPPLRLAADRVDVSERADGAPDAARREVVTMAARLDGREGSVLLETLRPAG